MNQREGTNYSKEQILQGNRIQREGREQVETFPQSSGANDYRPLGDLSKSHGTRMAGDVGGFALALMTNKQMANNVSGWMKQFGDSNQGFQFNQARMMKAGMLQDKQQQQQQQKPKQNGQEGPKNGEAK